MPEALLMRLGRQVLLSIAILAAALTGWAFLLPEARPILAALGLSQDAPARDGGPTPSAPRSTASPVLVQPFTRQVQTDVLSAIGTARGIRSVSLSAEVTGRITSVRVTPGEHVAKDAVLIELDSEDARITLERSRLLVADALETRDRLARLAPSGAVTDQQLREAELALKSAELEEQTARIDLSRHRILSPIDGWIGLIPAEAGDMIAAGTPIASVEDRSSLIVEFRLPERVATVVKPGDLISARSLTGADAAVEGRISALDNRISPESRSLGAEAVIPNPDDHLRPGMALSVTITLAGPERLAVDPLAIQWGANGAFVWIARDGKAERLPARILQRLADRVLIDATPQEGDLVITEGIATLRPGAAVAPAPEGG
ncbi:MAG TPA: efflux RND transporter periplasmic adaptor subunit [Paracoccaceae bacterium]|nr:efflux RND transporter periplasmic adaptor subunit [Paracoccaceae bacterium]